MVAHSLVLELFVLRDFFQLIYQVLLGQNQGPRLGSFIKLYGIDKTCNLIKKILKDGLV